MNTLNHILSHAFSMLLGPLAGSPLGALLSLSALAGVLMTIAFRCTSNQRALRAAADRSRAMLLRLRLFKDDFALAMQCQGELLRATGSRLLHSLPPMVFLFIPFFLVLSQLALWLEHRPLRAGEASVVELRVAPEAWPTWRSARLELPAGVRAETPALRDEGSRTLAWRLRVESPSSDLLRWRAGGAVVEKQLMSAADSTPLHAVSALRPGPSALERLLHPGEPGFDQDSPVRGIAVDYPRRSIPVLGLDMPWWATFLIASMLAALAARPLVKVEL